MPVTAGTKTLKEAVNAALRDWAATVTDTHYIIGSVVGPHPFPQLVRDLQRVIGDEARAQYAERLGSDPDVVVACVGGGSNAIGMFTAFVGAPGVRLVGVEAGGRGMDLGEHCSSITQGQPGRAARRDVATCCRTPTGRSSRHTRSRRASTTRASGRSTPGCTTRASPST